MTIAEEPPFNKFTAITIREWKDGVAVIKRVTGHRNCQTLIALYENLKQGVTALEMGTWAYRLGGYIHVLRSRDKLDIVTHEEPHDGGKHARYFLQTPIEIIGIEGSHGV